MYEAEDVTSASASAEGDGAGGGEGARVAVKALSLRGMRGWKDLELFQREANVLRNLSHPGIPEYIDFFEVSIPHPPTAAPFLPVCACTFLPLLQLGTGIYAHCGHSIRSMHVIPSLLHVIGSPFSFSFF